MRELEVSMAENTSLAAEYRIAEAKGLFQSKTFSFEIVATQPAPKCDVVTVPAPNRSTRP